MTYCFIKCRSGLLTRRGSCGRIALHVNFARVCSCGIFFENSYVAMVWTTYVYLAPVGISALFRSVAQQPQLSYVAIVQLQLAFSTKARLGASACAFFTHLCPHFARQVRRTKPRFIRVCSCGIFFENSYVAIVQLQLAFSTKARLGASACAYCISILFFSLINLS